MVCRRPSAQAVSDQGDISYTTSGYDLAISGDGFFIVQGADGTPVLTRAGDFTKDDEGNLVNSAGFTLMGYPYGSSAPAVVVNGFDGLVPINVLGDQKLEAVLDGEWYVDGQPQAIFAHRNHCGRPPEREQRDGHIRYAEIFDRHLRQRSAAR